MGDFCVKKQPDNRFTKRGCPLLLDKPVKRGLGMRLYCQTVVVIVTYLLSDYDLTICCLFMVDDRYLLFIVYFF